MCAFNDLAIACKSIPEAVLICAIRDSCKDGKSVRKTQQNNGFVQLSEPFCGNKIKSKIIQPFRKTNKEKWVSSVEWRTRDLL